MKQAIHPTYHTSAKISCACGNAIEVGSTRESVKVELCSKCHPFYTGKQKIVDTARRVDRFQQRVAKKKIVSSERGTKREKKVRDAKRRAAKTTKIEE